MVQEAWRQLGKIDGEGNRPPELWSMAEIYKVDGDKKRIPEREFNVSRKVWITTSGPKWLEHKHLGERQKKIGDGPMGCLLQEAEKNFINIKYNRQYKKKLEMCKTSEKYHE